MPGSGSASRAGFSTRPRRRNDLACAPTRGGGATGPHGPHPPGPSLIRRRDPAPHRPDGALSQRPAAALGTGLRGDIAGALRAGGGRGIHVAGDGDGPGGRGSEGPGVPTSPDDKRDGKIPVGRIDAALPADTDGSGFGAVTERLLPSTSIGARRRRLLGLRALRGRVRWARPSPPLPDATHHAPTRPDTSRHVSASPDPPVSGGRVGLGGSKGCRRRPAT